jgi:hypothetical protein
MTMPDHRLIPLARLTRLAAACGLCAALGACAFRPVEPWVKPYERERLADPVMKADINELPAKQRDHIYTVREGARGATGVQGGGCGCN